MICSAPSPTDTASPNTVATIESTSIAFPHGPWIPSPSTGWNADETRGGSLRLYVKYPNVRPGTARIAHMCTPKWKLAMFRASTAARSEAGSVPYMGGFA